MKKDTNTHSGHVCLFKRLHKIFVSLSQNEVEGERKWVRLGRGGWQEHKRERWVDRAGEVGEKARDEESRCSLYPPATSLILTMKDRNTEEKSQKGRRCIIKPLFCSLHFSLFLFVVSLTHLLFLFCVMFLKGTDMSAKRTIRNNKFVIVGEGKITHHRF